MVVDTTDIRHSGSSPDLCRRNTKSKGSFNGALQVPIEYSNSPVDTDENIGDPWNSPKREVCDTSDQGHFLHEEVDLGVSVCKDEVDIKPIVSVDVPDFSDSGSTANNCSEAPLLKRKLELTKEIQYNQGIKHPLKNPAKLVTKGTDNAPSTSAVTETPAVTNKFTTKHYRFICDKCNFVFKSKEILEGHLSKCNGSMNCDQPLYRKTGKGAFVENRYACNLCIYKSRELRVMKRHVMSHTGEKPHVCNICDSKFSHSSSLKIHMRTHTGDKPHACNICSYKFSRSSDLQQHMRTHTGEKHYACKICGYKSSRLSLLIQHMRTHTGEKPHACNICDSKFTQSSSLKIHMRTHRGEKPHVCDICSYKFTRSGDLKQHMKTHTGEKPYACKICGYKSSRLSLLIQHIRTHTGEKPHACIMCNLKFSSSSNLKRHVMRNHTG